MRKSLLRGFLAVWVAGAVRGQSVGPLLHSMRRGDMSVMRAAVEKGAGIECPDEHGDTLLMHTAVYGTVSDMSFLLERGANPNAANNAGHTALMRSMPELQKVKLLVSHGARVNAVTSDGTTPLMIAANIRGAADVVSFLLRHGADFRPRNKAGLDAVMLAAAQGEAGNLRLLLRAGASGGARARNVAVSKPRDSEVDSSQLDLRKKRAEGVTALMDAAHSGCGECVRLLLEHGADAQVANDSGLTALHRAAYQADPEMVRLLLDAGAPVNAADDRGFTPLMIAVNSRTRNPQVVRTLLDHGAGARDVDASGRSVLQWAAIGSNREILQMLPAAAEGERVKTALPGSAGVSGTVRSVVQQSVALLRENGPRFFPRSGCISCHNVSIPMMALTEAHRRGMVNPASIELMRKQTVAALTPQRDNLLSGYCALPGFATTATYGLISLAGAGYQADLLTDSIVRCLVIEQYPDGRWKKGGDERPPLSPESGIPGTALAARTIRLYPVPALASKLESSLLRARRYLLTTPPQAGDDYPFRALGLFWTGAAQTEITAAVRDLLEQQRSDGGWAQSPAMAPDAYATGQALAALSIVQPGLIGDGAYRRGVDFLMNTRLSDGSWHVRSRAFGFQPYFESGFPHGPDQWVSMAATAWATLALIPAVEP